jgi:hypothetical protein
MRPGYKLNDFSLYSSEIIQEVIFANMEKVTP